MRNLCSEVLALLEGKTLATAESLTGGGIGSAITAIPGSSAVYKGGIISYTNEVKERILGVSGEVLRLQGAVSREAAEAMAQGVRKLLDADVAVSVTGLAGPGGDEFGNPVGTVFVGYSGEKGTFSQKFQFVGGRDEVRRQTVQAALDMLRKQLDNG